MIATQTLLVLQACLALYSLGSNAEPVSWIPVSASEALLRRPDPIGLEGDSKIHTFACRAFEVYTMIPGRLVVDNGTAVCKNSFNGGEAVHTEFEVLDIPAGAASWVPANGKAPANAIVAGKHWSGPVSFYCRVWHQSQLIPGAFAGPDCDEPLCPCYYGYDGKEYNSRANVELLVLNNYGVALGLEV